MGNEPRRRWFALNGTPGDRTLSDQLRGLRVLRAIVPGKTVLDLGCAEGLLTGAVIDWGADLVHGLEIVPEAVEDARSYLHEHIIADRCSVMLGSVSELDQVDGLLESYDVVMALAVIQKVERVDEALLAAAARAREVLVIRNPPEHGRIISTARQRGRQYDTREIIKDTHFLAHVDRGWNSEWVGYFAAHWLQDKVKAWMEN